MANKIFNTDKRIKLGVWGLGRGGDLIACCKALNIDVVAGCDFNEHIRENFRKHAPDVFLTADEDEFLAQDMDAVLVATWFMDHAKHSIKALNAGKHVMCEVTSFYTPAEAVALVEAVEKSGKVYNLLENYPFMKPNMIAKKLWDDGLFGEFLYGEYDYNHDCRVLSYAYIDGTPVQPGWAVHNWRSWFNGHYYCTHSLGPLMYVTGLRPVQVSAPKLSIPLPGWVNDFRHTPSVSFVTMNNGGIFRNFMGSMTLDSHSRKIWGTRAAYDFTEDCLVSIGARGDGRKYVLKPEWPEMGDLAETMGHGGGDFWELYYFAREILTGEKANLPELPAMPGRPPALCPGCPHRVTYQQLKKHNLTVFGDIGCYTLGALPPLSSVDTSLCMGASVGMAFGMEKARGKEFSRHAVAVIGDSTFMHSGITPLIDACYNGGTITVLILDNRITGMTGHQENPASGFDIHGNPAPMVDLEAICRACGAASVRTVDPFDVKAFDAALEEEIAREAVSVLIVKRPCVLLKGERK